MSHGELRAVEAGAAPENISHCGISEVCFFQMSAYSNRELSNATESHSGSPCFSIIELKARLKD